MLCFSSSSMRYSRFWTQKISMALSLKLIFNLFVIFAAFPYSSCQQTETPSPAAYSCNGIFLSYSYIDGAKIPPNLNSNPAAQPYRFESALTVLNNGLEELKSWRVFVGFHNNEVLVSASNAVLADGSKLPVLVGNGTIFAGFPSTILKTAVETAGDVTQMHVKVDLIGTQFGVASPEIPMPMNISLVNDGYACGESTMQGTSEMHVCCIPDSKIKTNIRISDEFLPRREGDLVIMYDVTKTYDSSYWGQVTISNRNPLGRLDNWKLSWDWMMGEFIYSMRGAYPYKVDSSECVFGAQGSHYQGMDFSEVLNCERRPTIVDLPFTKANDTNLGLVPYCCRNGTILPQHMDPSKSKSSFQMHVFKMPPELNRSQLTPPQNWKINGGLNPSYQCGPPMRVSPSQQQSSTELPSQITAAASWQIVCNITRPKSATPKCCVSFSAYYNESVIPCRTCSCGCPTILSRSCSSTSSAMLVPPEALLVPFDNREEKASSWAALKHFPVPNPTPCGDNCGVSINWHVHTDYSTGWSARITLFNWNDFDFADWFVAVEMNRTAPGFQATYSFNGTILEADGANNTIFMQGLPGLNYLAREKDPRLPGKLQSVISFTKKNIQRISVPVGDGFPSKVFFNGEECLIPKLLPTAASFKVPLPPSFFSLILSVLIIIFVH